MDIMDTTKDPAPGIFIVRDKRKRNKVHALVTGPDDTPYEGGFFYMILRFPHDYPLSPPIVKLMTTGEGKVDFNPKLYSNGTVCLSTLGTYFGPSWSPDQNLKSVLVSIQSLMNEKPYFNEPGMTEINPGDSNRYNESIKHETLRVAVCDMLSGGTADSRNLPQDLRTAMEMSFLRFYDYYVSTAKANKHLNKKAIQGLFGDTRGEISYTSILKRVKKIKKKLIGL